MVERCTGTDGLVEIVKYAKKEGGWSKSGGKVLQKSPKYKITYVPHDQVSKYLYTLDLNTRLCVG